MRAAHSIMPHLEAPQRHLAAAHAGEPRRRGLRYDGGRQRADDQHARLRGRLEAAHPARMHAERRGVTQRCRAAGSQCKCSPPLPP